MVELGWIFLDRTLTIQCPWSPLDPPPYKIIQSNWKTIPYVHKLQDEIDEGVWGGCPWPPPPTYTHNHMGI